jgi:hypothetical protein
MSHTLLITVVSLASYENGAYFKVCGGFDYIISFTTVHALY